MEEFESKSAISGMLRVAGFLGSFLLFIIGFVLFFSINRIIGNIIMMLSIIIIGYSIYLSSKDTSNIKYLNIIAKGFVALMLILIVYGVNINP
ncbi:MAG: hypothetical protein ACMXYL_05330 [Candidatus Woesearchaeota archaeon]